MKTPFISLVIVNYNGKHLLKNSLNSIFNLDYPKTKLEVILVDNGSTDDSVKYVKEKFPKVDIIMNDENNYCKANNLGIKEANGEYIGFINNDVKLERHWLKSLLEVIKNGSMVGGMGKILFEDGRIQSTGHYELPNFYWGDRGFKEEDEEQFDNIEEIESVPNVASLYSIKVFEKMGKFDEDFQMYLEDIDMGIRCKKRNMKFAYVPQAVCYHKFHGTAQEEFLKYKIEKNRLLLIAKHYPEKLENSLFGEGYFGVRSHKDNKRNIFEILPEIMKKLLKHHSVDKFKSIFPGLIKEISNIYSYDRYYLIQSLRELESVLEEKILTKQKELESKINIIDSKNQVIRSKNKKIESQNRKLKSKDQKVEFQREEMKSKKKELETKDQEIKSKGKMIEILEREIEFKNQKIESMNEEIKLKKKKIKSRSRKLSQKEKKIGIKRGENKQLKDQLNSISNRFFEQEEKIIEKEKEIYSIQQKLDKIRNEIKKEKEKKQVYSETVNNQKRELEYKNNLILKKDKELSRLDNIIQSKEEKLQYFYDWTEKFYNSQTYRFILRPLWFLLDIPKRIFNIGRFGHRRYTIVKSYDVDYFVVEKLVNKLRKKYKKIIINMIDFSNSRNGNHEFDLSNVDLIIKFGSQDKIVKIISLVKTFYYFILNGSDKTYLVLNKNLSKKYRKLKLFVLLSRTNCIRLYLEDGTIIYYPSIFKLIFLFTLRSISLYFLALFFLLFIEVPYKILEFIQKTFYSKK